MFTPAGIQQADHCGRANQRNPANTGVLSDSCSEPIYRHPSIGAHFQSVSQIGNAIHDCIVNGAAATAVRNRRDLIACEIDRISETVRASRVLSLACGHLREGAMSEAVLARRLDQLVAIDQDASTVAVVKGDLGQFGVEGVVGSVRTILSEYTHMGQFDFVYAAGLYDYPSNRLATRLLSVLFSLLRPGGKVWIANFLPDIDIVGYMETFMDWWLIYRSESQLAELLEGLPAEQILSHRTFVENARNVAFLGVVRA